MDLTNIGTIQSLLKVDSTWAMKNFGQNFLIDCEVLELFIAAADLKKGETVIEVGPGLGTVTLEIAKRAGRLFAFEIDESKIPILDKVLKSYDNTEIILQDFLQVNLPQFLKDHGVTSYKFISSLPYNISKKIIQILLESENCPDTITVIIQKEVALKYIPKKKGKFTFLSNYLEIFSESAEIVTTFGPESFFPSPKVDSAIMHIKVGRKGDSVKDRKLAKFIKSGFAKPRKKLSNVLSGVLNMESEKVVELFKEKGINPNARAENLTLEEWRFLSYFCHQK